MSLQEMLKELPLNRKERFFTGTVLPMIVCKDNFKNIHILLSLVGIFETTILNFNPSESNVLFFTEYSLVESLIGKDKHRFKGLPKTKDTPDIIIYIKSAKKKLVALEAKMYDVPTADKLNDQMEAQQKILKSIEISLDTDKPHHYLLLPEKLAKQSNGLEYPVITWEALQAAYEPVCKDDYFFELLRISLNKYDELVSPGITYGINCEEKISGQQILKRFQSGTMDKISMGRDGGIDGLALKQDITTGKWQTFPYETSSQNLKGINRNWFLIEEFVKRIECI